MYIRAIQGLKQCINFLCHKIVFSMITHFAFHLEQQ